MLASVVAVACVSLSVSLSVSLCFFFSASFCLSSSFVFEFSANFARNAAETVKCSGDRIEIRGQDQDGSLTHAEEQEERGGEGKAKL